MWGLMSSHVGLGQRLGGLYLRQILYTSERMVYKFPVLLNGYILLRGKTERERGREGKRERQTDRVTETDRERKKSFVRPAPKPQCGSTPKPQ